MAIFYHAEKFTFSIVSQVKIWWIESSHPTPPPRGGPPPTASIKTKGKIYPVYKVRLICEIMNFAGRSYRTLMATLWFSLFNEIEKKMFPIGNIGYWSEIPRYLFMYFFVHFIKACKNILTSNIRISQTIWSKSNSH